MKNEHLIISCILVDQSCHDMVIPQLKPDFFTQEGEILDVILRLYKEAKPIDLYTIRAQLPDRLSDLLHINNLVASSANVLQYLAQLKDDYIRRYMQKLFGHELDLGTDPHDYLNDRIQELINLQDGVTPQTCRKLVDIVDEVVKRIDERKKFPEKAFGVPTPLTELNNLTQGWQPGNLYVLAGRPSMGKTAFELACARSACEAGKSVAIFSMEMKDDSLIERILKSIDDELYEAAGRVSSWKLQPFDKGGMDISFIKSQSRLWQRENGLDMIFIDYLGLMKMPDKELRAYQIGEITHQLKAFAMEMNLPIMLLCQLNRDSENRSDGLHRLSDLRESGDIEQDADMVIFISRPARNGFREDALGASTDNLVVLQVEKNRHGPAPRLIKCRHNPTVTWFTDNNSFTE
jgi:replicative DNA helicase